MLQFMRVSEAKIQSSEPLKYKDLSVLNLIMLQSISNLTPQAENERLL